MENTKTLTTTAMLVALSTVLALLIYIVPIVQFLLFLIAIPLVIVGVKFGIKVHALALLVFGVLMTVLNPLYSIILICIIGPLSISQGYLMHQKKTASETIFFGSIATFFGVVGILYLMNGLLNVNLVNEFKFIVDSTMDQVKTFYENSNLLNESELSEMTTILDDMKSTITMLLPSTIAMFAFFNSLFCFLMSRKIMKRLNIIIKYKRFMDFRIDKQGRLMALVALGVVTVLALIDKNNMSFYVFNFMIVFVLGLQINGAALVWYLSDKHPNRKALRIMFIILFILSPLLGSVVELVVRYGLAVVGLLDMYIHFRHKIEHRNNI